MSDSIHITLGFIIYLSVVPEFPKFCWDLRLQKKTVRPTEGRILKGMVRALFITEARVNYRVL